MTHASICDPPVYAQYTVGVVRYIVKFERTKTAAQQPLYDAKLERQAVAAVTVLL